MGQQPLTDGQCQQAIDAYALYGDARAAGKSLNLPENTFRNRIKEGRRRELKISKGITDKESPKHLLAQIKELQSDLKKAQATEINHEIVKHKIIELKSAVSVLEPLEWLLDPGTSISAPGVPTLMCSDWHAGEVVKPSQIGGVNTYNMTIFRERVKVLVLTAIKLLKIVSPKMDYPGIVVPLGGDFVSGNIHDELTATNELNTMPTVLELYGAISWMLDELLKEFPRIFLPCTSGNHGRDTKKIWKKDRHHTSFDWLLYCFLAKRYEHDKRVTFLIPDGPDAYYKIYNHRFLLSHGDQYRGGDGVIGALGPIIRGDHRKRSRNSQINMPYDVQIMGHFHQYMHLTRLIVNGSLKGYDEYAYTENFPFEFPQQALFLNHPRYAITYRMPVYVDPNRGQKSLVKSWVSLSS